MHLGEVGQALKRRWYLVVAALLVTVATVAGLMALVPADYETSASVVLVPPESTLGDTGNPYLFLGGLDQLVDVVARSMNDGLARSTIEDATPPGAAFTATADFTTSAPIILATAEASTPQQAADLLNVVVEQVARNLSQLQGDVGVPSKALIGSQVVARNDPEALQKPRLRKVAVAGIAVLMLSLLLIALLDSVLTRLRQDRD